MRGERGQVTIFVVVGLVLLVLVGLIYLVISIGESAPDAGDRIDLGVLDSYLSSCLDTVVHAQLRDLQNGALDFAGRPSAMVGDRRVLYGVTQNQDLLGPGIGPFAYPVPQYPDWDVSANNAEAGLATFQDGYFGDTWWPAVCEKQGPNNPRATFTCKYYEGNPPGTSGPSVQGLLTERIVDGVSGCADLRAFEDALGVPVSRVGEPGVNITLTLDNIIIDLTYPVELAGDATTRKETFRKIYDIRLMPLLRFAHDLSRAETRDPSFDPREDGAGLQSYRPGFIVSARADAPIDASSSEVTISSQHADFVTVTDTRSLIDGESYSISFLIEHRIPMLEPISDAQWDGILASGSTSAVGVDPDGGNVTIDVCDPAETAPPCEGSWRVVVIDGDGDMDWEDHT